MLERLVWTYVPREALEAEQSGEREVLLKGLDHPLRPQRSHAEEQMERAIFELEHVNAVGMARNLTVHEYLTFGLPLTVNTPRGQDTRNVRFFDYDHPEGGLKVEEVLTGHAVIEWQTNEDVQRQMRRDVKGSLRATGLYDEAQVEELANLIVQAAKSKV